MSTFSPKTRTDFGTIDISQAVVPKNKARGLRVKRKRIVKIFLRVPPVLEYNYKKFVPSLHASKGQLFWTFKGHI